MQRINAVLLGLTLAIVPVVGAVHANHSGHYDGAGVVVADAQAEAKTDLGEVAASVTFLDNGAVVCDNTNFQAGQATGVGGICIPFKDAPGSAVDDVDGDGSLEAGIEVADDDATVDEVTFQVCIDNNGDRVCTFQGGKVGTGPCADTIRFSHADGGVHYNPLRVPVGFTPGCGGNGGFPGWIVIVCAGEHANGDDGAHVHHATTGSVEMAPPSDTSSDTGDYCGAPTASKAYVTR